MFSLTKLSNASQQKSPSQQETESSQASPRPESVKIAGVNQLQSSDQEEEDVRKQLRKQVDERFWKWHHDIAVLEVKERLQKCVDRQFLLHTGSKLSGFGGAKANRTLDRGFAKIGLERLQAAVQKLKAAFLKSQTKQQRRFSFFGGMTREHPEAVISIFDRITSESALAYVYDKLNLSRLLNIMGEVSAKTSSEMVLSCIGELDDVYAALESSLQFAELNSSQKQLIRSSITYLGETLRQLVELIIDCTKQYLLGRDLEGDSELLARSIWLGSIHTEYILLRLIREGRFMEIKLAFQQIMRTNGFLDTPGRLQLLHVLQETSRPLMAKWADTDVKGIRLKRCLTETDEAKEILSELSEPLMVKLLNEVVADLSIECDTAMRRRASCIAKDAILDRTKASLRVKSFTSERVYVIWHHWQSLASKDVNETSVLKFWEEHGENIVKAHVGDDAEAAKFVFDKIQELVIEPLEKSFNGEARCSCDVRKFHCEVSYSGLISHMDPLWNGTSKTSFEERQKAFDEAVAFTCEVLTKKMKYLAEEVYVGLSVVNKGVAESVSGVILLERFVPWRDHIYDVEEQHGKTINWVAFQDDRNGQWRVTSVSDKLNRFTNRALLDPALRGKSGAEIAAQLGMENVGHVDLFFVHHSGFTGGAPDRDSLFKLLDFKPVAQ